MRQYEIDTKRFISSLSRLTGIDEEYIKVYAKKKSLNSLFFDSPPAELTKTEIYKLELLKEFKIAYEMETDRQAGFNLGSSSKSGSYFIDYFRSEENRAHLCAVYLNNSSNLIAIKKLGDMGSLIENKKLFISNLLDHNVTSVVLGRYNPSDSYIKNDSEINNITYLKTILDGIKVDIVDFTIVNKNNSYYSFAESGYIDDINTKLNKQIKDGNIYETHTLDASIHSKPNGESNRIKLSKSISGLTGIKDDKLSQYFKENQVKNIFEVNQRDLTPKQQEKLSIFKEVKNSLPNILGNEMMGEYVLSSTAKASGYLKNYFSNIVDKEYFLAVFMDKQDRVIKTQVCSEGTKNECPIYTREITKSAILNKAVSVIFSHNHPGGSPKVSNPDITATGKLILAMKNIDVEVKDHIIVCGKQAVSIREFNEGMFKENSIQYQNQQKALESQQGYLSERYLVAWKIQNEKEKAKECHSLREVEWFIKKINTYAVSSEIWKSSGEYWHKSDQEGIIIESRREICGISAGERANDLSKGW